MLAADPDLRRAVALRAIRGNLLRLKWHVAALRFELALGRHDRALKRVCKAGYNSNQPRVGRGQPEGGQWTSGDSGGTDIEQTLQTANDQTPRRDQRELENIANDPAVRPEIEAARRASTVGSPQEHGFWITRNEATGELSTHPFENTGSAHSIVPGPAPGDAIAFFHTHPNRPEDGYAQGPSFGDERFAARTGLPG